MCSPLAKALGFSTVAPRLLLLDRAISPRARSGLKLTSGLRRVSKRMDRTKKLLMIKLDLKPPSYNDNTDFIPIGQDVDAVYIGTPHTYHYANSLLALNAGKHVLCEKPFTSNAAELRSLISIAKEKKLFLMEAMWTRFQPIAQAVSELIQSKALGEIRAL